ncbi:MAG TPA: hypothetical protein PKC19_18620 [Roseiflexaceae bacterium]|nr:hypothetical protein [Roseiflexaceae bacterium]
MGTLTSVTDPANATTNAVYDVFGRSWVLTRPGDTNGDATVYYSYDTSVIPMRTSANRKGVTQPGDMRPECVNTCETGFS